MLNPTLMTEKWYDIKGFEGLYQISNLGRVKSFKRQGSKGGIKAPRVGDTGYYQVWLSKPGFRREYKIHRLVAEVFIHNPDLKPFVCHKDGNKINNKSTNLYWGDYNDNAKDREKHKKDNIKEILERLERIEKKIDDLPINELLDPNGNLLSTINQVSAQLHNLKKS